MADFNRVVVALSVKVNEPIGESVASESELLLDKILSLLDVLVGEGVSGLHLEIIVSVVMGLLATFFNPRLKCGSLHFFDEFRSGVKFCNLFGNTLEFVVVALREGNLNFSVDVSS